MSKTQNAGGTERLPIVALRGLVLFPHTVTTVDLGRPKSIAAMEKAEKGDGRLFMVAQRDSAVDDPEQKDLYTVGVVVRVRHSAQMPNDIVKVLVEGDHRAFLKELRDAGECDEAVIEHEEEREAEPLLPDRQAVMRVASRLAEQIAASRANGMAEFLSALKGEQNPEVFCDAAASALIVSVPNRQEILECMDTAKRLELLLRYLSEEVTLAETEARVNERVQRYMEKANREYYLREQIHAIREELEEDDDEDVAELRRRLKLSKMPTEAREHVEKELKRLSRTSAQAPESAVTQNYIEYMLELPWGIRDKENRDIRRAERVLEEDHFGLREVKDRLIEYLAVRCLTDSLTSPIICLVGPPGVGKTSIARSVARALGRRFVRMSLGGVHDEAEIRGHRKTYVGAMPGRIVSSIHRVKTSNPVFLLDEIDKMAHDLRGDPASALLEALDPEQNRDFRDHYLETPFDLSDVLFITTANTTSTIDSALLDRMEVIEVPSYTLEEKVQIAKRHLVPKQLKAHGLTKSQLRVSEKTLSALIDSYTRESGVRTLERTVEKLCRKAALRYVREPERTTLTIKASDLPEYLGPVKYLRQAPEGKAAVGIVNGLAWTSVGGEVMPVEAAVYGGKGAVEITGSLGDVMKESARLARSAVRERLSAYGLAEDWFDSHDIHIHVPEGAVPKDGPSAGVALTCALLSAVTGIPARSDLAMTGEITLHGRVLPIGGVKEKLLAAYRMGITRIILPRENNKDLEEIEESIRERFTITLVDTVEDAIGLVLEQGGEA